MNIVFPTAEKYVCNSFPCGVVYKPIKTLSTYKEQVRFVYISSIHS